MTVSVATLQAFLESNNFVSKGSQESIDAAIELAGVIRSGNNGGQRKTYNVHDYLKRLSVEEVNTELDKTRSGMVNVFVNLLGDFNLASAIRLSNWHNVNSVWIVGRRRWDRRGAVGTHHYTPINYARAYEECFDSLRTEGYRIVAAEITDDATPLNTYEWTDKSAVIYGEEGAGLSEEILAAVDDVVYIPGRGSVRSLNVATTAGIFTYDYHSKLGLFE